MSVTEERQPAEDAGALSRGPYRNYTDAERATALAILDSRDGNVLRASKESGVPWQTLCDWERKRTRSASSEYVTNLREEKRLERAAQAEEIADLCLTLLPARLVDATPRDLAIIYGVVTDKSRLLRGDPTTITETRNELSDEERIVKVRELLARAQERNALPEPTE